ncbi:zinc finger domain-containing protein [Streptomyces parvus]|uniref:zinc finger domain-containing protein n=1 Tax=Streptomyces parvus TaxID=66428 RepID=UPI0035DEC100
MTDDEAFPTYYEYALAHRCSTCGAEPGTVCDAPAKNQALQKLDDAQVRAGNNPRDHDPLHRLHTTRQDAGSRHRARDIGKAPWPEDRVPGQRYDTLGQVRKSRTVH